jgi:hypothetical protein
MKNMISIILYIIGLIAYQMPYDLKTNQIESLKSSLVASAPPAITQCFIEDNNRKWFKMWAKWAKAK